jgi:hypothetical protein
LDPDDPNRLSSKDAATTIIAAAVGDAAGNRSGDGACHARKCEQRNAVLGQMKRIGQQKRRCGPEEAERTEQAGVIEGASLQDWRASGQTAHRRQ